MFKLIKTIFFFFILSASAYAAAPIIFYSDLQAGLATSSNTSNGSGAYVTIWGKNFGASQGGSTITVGGGAVAQVMSWANTEICFQLGSSSATGNIVVTVSSVASNGLAFTITTTGHIYFIQPGAGSNGSGSYSSPYNHIWYAYHTAVPGDTIYILAGTITNEVNGNAGYHTIVDGDGGFPQGNSTNPIAFIAYPGATVTFAPTGGTSAWTQGSAGGSDYVSYIFQDVTYAVISKFTLSAYGGAAAIQGAVPGERVIGNKISATNIPYGIVDIAGANWHVLGNEFTGSTCSGSCPNNEGHSMYIDGDNGASTGFEVGWNYFHNNYGQGFEISSYHNGPRSGSIHDNLLINDNSTDGGEKGILADGAGDSGANSTMYTNTMYVYNNILVNEGVYESGGVIQIACGTNYIYNNTIYYSGTESHGMIQLMSGACGPGGSQQVDYLADNIIVGNQSGLYISDNNQSVTPTFPSTVIFNVLADNIYYGEGNGPTQDTTAINSNPLLVSPTTDTTGNWSLQSGSPAIGAGYNTNSVVANDYTGLTRPNPPACGAYEYYSGSCSTNGNSCSTGATCCSTLCQASLCVSCLNNAQSCTSGSQCCSGSCVSNSCVAAPANTQCSFTGQTKISGQVYVN